MKRLILTLACCLGLANLLVATAVLPANATEPVTLKVAFSQLDGFFEYDEEGNPVGYGVDLLDKVGQCSGFKFEYVDVGPWERTKDALLSGQADVRLPVTLPKMPTETFGYTDESVMDTCYALLTTKARDDLYYKDYETFSTLKVAATRSLLAATGMSDHLAELGIPQDNVVLYDEYALCRQALENGEVDAVASNIMDLDDNLKILARFDSVSNYLSTLADSPYLDLLDTALNDIKMDDPAFLPSLYQKYYPERSTVPYTKEEIEYVNQTETINVGQLADRAPFSSIDEDGRIVGMFVDLCDLISRKCGLSFSYDLVPSGTRAIDWLEETEGDLVAGVMNSTLSSPSSKLSHTETAFPSSVVVIGRQNEPFDPESTQTIALPAGFIGGKEYLAQAYPHATLETFDTNEECLEAIESGTADIMLQDLYVARNALQSPRFKELEILPVYQLEESMSLVMTGNEDPRLISVLNKAIASITDDELNSIIVAHTIASPYAITLEDTLHEFGTPLLAISLLTLSTVTLLVCIIAIRHRNTLHLKAKNEQLAAAYQQAQSASRAKSDFLARMSHEIRTPINAIMGIASLAKDRAGKPEAIEEDLERITLSSKVLLSIINDVLDMSAIESGKLKMRTAPFDFKSVVSSLSTVYYPQCRAKGITFEVSFVNVVDEHLVGDQLRLNQVLMNLLSNAVKFTDSGAVRLIIEQRIVRQTQAFVHFEVADTGCGMDRHMLARLWQPFEQESAEVAQEHGGSGLGLSIVKSLVTLMGGAVKAETVQGVGTSFFVDLPFGRVVGEHAPRIRGLGEIRVLVVDDSKESRTYISAVLDRIGVSYDCAANAGEALDLLERSDRRKAPFDICIVDWTTPGMNGADATRRIRQRYDRKAVAIAASAYDRASTEKDAVEAGADHLIVKPLFQSTIFDLIMSLFGDSLVDEEACRSSSDLSGCRILLAEDNDMNRLVAVGLLEKAGATCIAVPNGKAAVDAFEASGTGCYGAILLDIQMPLMNGYEAAQAIRSLDRRDAATIPILALTANAFTEDIAEALQNGMDDHVPKPIEYDVLVTTLAKAIKRKGR